MRITRPNDFEVEETRARLEKLCTYWETEYGVEPTWSDSGAIVSGNIMGFSFEAELTIGEKQIVVEGPPPNILVRSRVVGYIERKLDEYLDPDVELDELR